MSNRAVLIALVILSAVGVVFGLVHSSRINAMYEQDAAAYRRIAEAYPQGFTLVPIGMRGGRCVVPAKPVAKIWIARQDMQTATWMIDGTCPGRHTVTISNLKRDSDGINPAADGNTSHGIDAASGATIQIDLTNSSAAEGNYTYDIQVADASAASAAGPPPAATPAAPSLAAAGGAVVVSGPNLMRYCPNWPCGN